MKNEQESIFAPYLADFISRRVEQLTADAEKQPDYTMARASIEDLLIKAAVAMETDDLDTLISAVRGTDIAIYEYIYRAGLKDGIWIAGQLDQIKQRKE